MTPPALDKLRKFAEEQGARTHTATSSGTLPSVRRKVDGEFREFVDVPVSVALLWVYAPNGRGYFGWRLVGLPGGRWAATGGNWRSASFIGLTGLERFKQLILESVPGWPNLS